MKNLAATALAAMLPLAASLATASAQDAKPLTVEQCITLLNGLNSLNCVGQQLNGTCAPDAKQYKLGGARMTIGLNIQALTPVLTTFQREQQKFMMDLPRVPAAEPGKPVPPEIAEMQADQNKKSVATQIDMLARPCTVTPGRLKWSELNLGDDADHNAIPPAVIGALGAMMDK